MSLPTVSTPWLGSRRSVTDTRMIAMRPSQNCGIACPMTPKTRMTLSTQLPRRSAAMTPSGIPMAS